MFDLAILCGLSIVLGCVFAASGWLLFWGRRKPKALIVMAALIPPLSAIYLVLTAIFLTIVVPNQSDEFFGDFSEPLPNGYILKGLGKMPDYAYFDTSNQGKRQPQTLGSVRSLEQNGQMIYGAYGHLNKDFGTLVTGDQGYFAFDTARGQIQNFDTRDKLDRYAGHSVHLVESQFFRSQDPGRKLLRKVESIVYAGPPAFATLFCLWLLVRFRVKSPSSTAATT